MTSSIQHHRIEPKERLYRSSALLAVCPSARPGGPQRGEELLPLTRCEAAEYRLLVACFCEFRLWPETGQFHRWADAMTLTIFFSRHTVVCIAFLASDANMPPTHRMAKVTKATLVLFRSSG
jgi:hypothetical protein